MQLRQLPLKTFAFVTLFILAHFSHHLLTALVIPMLPLIRDSFGLNYTTAGLVAAAFTFSNGLGQLPAGWLADKIGPRTVLTVGVAGVALAGTLVGLSGRSAAHNKRRRSGKPRARAGIPRYRRQYEPFSRPCGGRRAGGHVGLAGSLSRYGPACIYLRNGFLYSSWTHCRNRKTRGRALRCFRCRQRRGGDRGGGYQSQPRPCRPCREERIQRGPRGFHLPDKPCALLCACLHRLRAAYHDRPPASRRRP